MSTSPFPAMRAGILAAIVFLLVCSARVREYTTSDSQLTLLTAQSLWDHGALDLRVYYEDLGPKRFAKGTWKYSVGRAGVHYIYPLGASLISLPFVAAARSAGIDFSNWDNDRRGQVVLAAMSCATIFFLLAQSVWLLTRDRRTLLVVFALVLGSSLVSTLGTALWSFNVELVFAMLAIRELIRLDTGTDSQSAKGSPSLLGAFLAAAWIGRPTALTLIIPVVTWVWITRRHNVIRVAAGAAAVAIPFFVFCYAQMGLAIPGYYRFGRWTQSATLAGWAENVVTHLFSPARGLFVFTPSLLFALLVLRHTPAHLRNIVRVLTLWCLLTLFVVASQGNWWGGWSFGPRLLTEALPALVLLCSISMSAMWSQSSVVLRRTTALGYGATLAWGIAVHSGMGLFVPATYFWNDRPNIDSFPEFYRWIWRYPQFLATATRNEIKANGR